MDKAEKVEVTLKTKIDQTALDEVMRKIERIRDLMKEANGLAAEISAKEITLNLRLES